MPGDRDDLIRQGNREELDAARSDMRGTPQGISGALASAVLEGRKVSLMEKLSELMQEERTLEKAEWKV